MRGQGRNAHRHDCTLGRGQRPDNREELLGTGSIHQAQQSLAAAGQRQGSHASVLRVRVPLDQLPLHQPVHEAAGGQLNRAIRALQLETELRTDPSRRADRFVERWQKLDHTSGRQYQAGDIAGYKATRSAMGDMAKSLERDPQLESILANRKRDLGIAFESGRRLGQELAFTHGIDLGRGRGIEL